MPGLPLARWFCPDHPHTMLVQPKRSGRCGPYSSVTFCPLCRPRSDALDRLLAELRAAQTPKTYTHLVRHSRRKPSR